MKFGFESLSKYFAWACVALLVVSLSCFAIQSEDLFMYLAIAREYFKTGAFPVTDPFIFSIPNFQWTILHQWLGYLSFYGLYELGGYDLIVIIKTIFITAVFCFPLVLSRKSSAATLVWGLSVMIAVFAMSFRMMERTSLFSDFFIVIVLNILMREHLSPSRWKCLLPVIFGLWVNLHPGFPIGWFLCGLFLLVNIQKWRSLEFKKWIGVFLASVLVCLLNPKGLEGMLYPFAFMNNEGKVFREYYFEWMATLNPLFRWHLQSFFIIGLIILNLVLIYRARKTRPVFEIVASLFFIFYGLYAIRFVPSFCFALVTLNVSLALKATYPRWAGKLNLAVAVLALALAFKNMLVGYETISGHRDFGLGLDIHVVPYKAAELLDRSGLKENVFNSHLFGSYLAWAWEGKRKVIYHGFITDTNFFLKEFGAFADSQAQFDTQVAKYNIGAFLLDRFRGNEGLLKILVAHPRWQIVYKDQGSLIFVKRP